MREERRMGLAMRSVERIMVKCLIYDTRSVGLGKAAFGRHGRVLDSQNILMDPTANASFLTTFYWQK